MLRAALHSPFLSFAVLLVIVSGGSLLEYVWPAEANQPARNTVLNTLYGVMVGMLRLALTPALGIAVTLALNRLGAGWIVLPAHGWALAASALVYIATIDFLEFAFHRAQHGVPFLWAMHSFHHSDPAVNVSTGVRNFWLETPIKMLFVYPIAALLFSVPPAVLAIYAGTTVWHSVNHLNVRWRLPIPWFVLNNPQFHRLHHSINPAHYNKNFSPYFPIWDLLAGTAYVPRPDEYPPTGLAEEPEPVGFADALLWPWRHRLRDAKANSAVAPG
ncbi:MAG TPA: sterol desaturase family protein [Rhizomicrobium sp.]|nr:sterol desaturase family protein [Rhizomicrobium sp.]